MDVQLDLDAEMELAKQKCTLYSRQILLDGWDIDSPREA